MIVYGETSAVAKLLVEERESAGLAAWLDAAADRGDSLLSSTLLETELRRLAVRVELDQSAVTAPLDTMLTYDVRQADAARRSGLPTLAP